MLQQLDVELVIRMGRGYVPAVQNKASGAEIVTVAIRRTNIGQEAGAPSLLDALPPSFDEATFEQIDRREGRGEIACTFRLRV